ncbi:MAG TPA: hypothetical protein VMM92_12995, partial [Thermoanaerobaculia bacterium]|nr:hypothetical protein [Thermoanaerobaculia bacterium]
MKTASLISGVCLCLLTASVSPAQIITTVAGTATGTGGYGGDGGPATSAQLYGPHGVAVSATGDIYIADTVNNCVRKVSANTGIITPFAGLCGSPGAYGGDTLPATQANLNAPFNLFIDPAGNVYITDSNNHAVRKVDTSGVITTIAGSGAPCNQVPSPCGDGGPATLALLKT